MCSNNLHTVYILLLTLLYIPLPRVRSMVGAIKGCTGKEPIVVGKPSALMIDYIVDKYKVQRGRITMVGDRLDTDVLFGSGTVPACPYLVCV